MHGRTLNSCVCDIISETRVGEFVMSVVGRRRDCDAGCLSARCVIDKRRVQPVTHSPPPQVLYCHHASIATRRHTCMIMSARSQPPPGIKGQWHPDGLLPCDAQPHAQPASLHMENLLFAHPAVYCLRSAIVTEAYGLPNIHNGHVSRSSPT